MTRREEGEELAYLTDEQPAREPVGRRSHAERIGSIKCEVIVKRALRSYLYRFTLLGNKGRKSFFVKMPGKRNGLILFSMYNGNSFYL